VLRTLRTLPAAVVGRRTYATLAWGLAFVLPLALVLALVFPPAHATEAPPLAAFDYVLETFGPNFPISQGAWYSNPANGIGVGYYYLDIAIPCGWPADKPIAIDLFSPELTRSGASDEARSNGSMATVFELYQPGTPVGPGIAEPGPGAPGSLRQTSYQPSGAQANWRRFYTIAAPAACGTYVLRSEAGDDDGNVWRVRVGFDNDNNPNNTPPARYDNPDGVAGTGDEPVIGVLQSGFKHPRNPNSCLTLFEYVSPGQSQVVFHNFDMESSGTVMYISPNGQSFPGTASARIRWNNGTLTDRGLGDPIANPEPGWWKIITCAGSDTHFVQEGQQGVPAYFQQPPTPRMLVSKDDGRVDVNPNELLDYTIQFTNTANLAPFPLAVPGAAQRLVIADTLPPHTIFQSCAIDAPYSGSCTLSAGVVTYTLNGKVNAGAGGSVRLALLTAPDIPPGPVRNDVTLSYRDDLGNLFLANGSDIDAITAADLSLTKTVDQPRPNVGDLVTFVIGVHNDGPAVATDVAVSDLLPDGLAFVSSTPGAGFYDEATGTWAIGSIPVGGDLQLALVARVAGAAAVTNLAQVSAADQPDPDSAPGNSNPAEDDQASVTVTPQVADLSLTKSASNSLARNGDPLVYTITVMNQGPDAATGVAVADLLPDGLQYQGAQLSQGSYEPASGTWAIGPLAVGQRATLTLNVLVTTDNKVTNTAQVSAAAQFDPDSTPGNSNPAEDDQASVTTPIAPTAITLSSFTAVRKPGGVLVEWATSSEVQSWAFAIYRSADGLRAHATRITAEPILAKGHGQGGASYSWLDQAADAAPASYWLVEIEHSGTTHEYGPVVVMPIGMAVGQQLFVPVAAR
jgi:uncharacterized repeat protein (TIGR01451 family)